MNADEFQALDCICLLAKYDRMYRGAEVMSHDGTDLSSVDTTVAFWVRPSSWEERFGLTRRFDLDGDKDMYTSHAYA